MTTYDVQPNDVISDSSGTHYIVYLNYKDEPYATSGGGWNGVRIDSLDQPQKLVPYAAGSDFMKWVPLTPLPEPVAEPQEFGARVTDANGVKALRVRHPGRHPGIRRAWRSFGPKDNGGVWESDLEWSDLAQPVTLGWDE